MTPSIGGWPVAGSPITRPSSLRPLTRTGTSATRRSVATATPGTVRPAVRIAWVSPPLAVQSAKCVMSNTRWYDAYSNPKAAYQRVFDITHFADFAASGGDTQAILTAGRTVPGVAVATERRVADVPVQVNGRKLLGRVIGLPATGQPPIDGVMVLDLSLIHISEPTRRTPISYAVFCLKKKKK